MVRINEFMRRMNSPEKGIDVTMQGKNKEKCEENREILTSIIKCLEFCGRQGIGLRGHRDENTTSNFNNDNFKKLLEVIANSGDNTIRNAMYS